MKKPESFEQRKPTKTISGVAPLAVMLPPRKCKHGTCLYCPSLNAPQSYTPESPAVLRASSLKYDAYGQVRARLEAFKAMNHPTDKIELIIMGGTFLSFPEKFQFEFVKRCYDALNGKTSKDLEQAKKLNEKTKHRCVALCIETRPDVCNEKEINNILKFGATRVEIGVQCIDNKIYSKINRGHLVKDVINTTERLKRAGFKIGYHIMPGLPLSSLKKDIKMYKEIFKNNDFKPDQVKIYPCQVLKGAELAQVYYKGKYKPYTKQETEKIIIEFLKLTPEYCRVMRVMREIPPIFLVAGVVNIDLRKDIEEEIRKKKIKIKEIRFREIGFALRDNREINKQIKIKKIEYNASNGKEIFLEAVNKDNLLFALLRLRFDKDTNFAIVRELHVYGPALNLGERGIISQHKGLGKMLLIQAESLTKQHKKQEIKIISGVGVREYYCKLGYKLDKNKTYMVKNLK